MSNGYAPTTNEVRADYVRDHTRNFDEYQTSGRTLTSEQEVYGARFDHWLERVKAEAKAEALEEAAQIAEDAGCILHSEAEMRGYRLAASQLAAAIRGSSRT